MEQDDGTQSWVFEGNHYPNVGLNAVVGRPREEWSMEPARFDEMRPGCFDIEARIADMDRAGIWASLCFPSLVSGFCGAVYSRAHDRELGLACLRAFNDWHLEVWAGTHPERIIPLQLPVAGRRRAGGGRGAGQRGAGLQGGELPRVPGPARLPSIFSGRWDPFFAACEETDTVVCLHTGASAWAPLPSPDPPFELLPTLFPVNALLAAGEWLWSGVPLRFPGLQGRHVRGRHRLGAHADGPGRLRARALGLGHREHAPGRPTCCRARCCGATSGSAPSTTRPPWRSAT